MLRDLTRLFLDNPVLVKHLRSRLRRNELFPSIGGLIAVLGMGLWSFAATDKSLGSLPYVVLVVQGFVLLFGGTTQVLTSISRAKEVGVLDFHRISPQSPLALTIGFGVGGAIREWLLYAITLPFLLISCIASKPGLGGFLTLTIGTVMIALLYAVTAVCAGLIVDKTRNATGTVTGAMLLFHWILAPFGFLGFGFAHITIYPVAGAALNPSSPPALFYGLDVPVLLVSILHQVPLIVYILIAAVRRMRHDRSFFLTKRQAVTAFGVFAAVTLGDSVVVREIPNFLQLSGIAPASFVYGAGLMGTLLIAITTPGWLEMQSGIVRARLQGAQRPNPWSPLAGNWASTLAISALAMVGTTMLGVIHGQTGIILSGLVVGVHLIGVSSAKQAFDLAFRKHSLAFLALLYLILWVAPLVVGGVLGSTGPGTAGMGAAVGAISPLMSIGILAYTPQAGTPPTEGMPNQEIAALLALAPGVITTLALTQFRIRMERRVRRSAVESSVA